MHTFKNDERSTKNNVNISIAIYFVGPVPLFYLIAVVFHVVFFCLLQRYYSQIKAATKDYFCPRTIHILFDQQLNSIQSRI